MKFYTMAIGAGLGYLAGNERARRKTIDTFKQLKGSPQAKAIEDRVSTKANELTSKVTRRIDVTEPANGAPTIGGADAVDTSSKSSHSSAPKSSYSSAPLTPDHSVIG
jgi:hypothetical protein